MGFFDAFTGKAQAGQIKKADKAATAALGQGFGQQQQYYDQAAGMYDPYVQQGGEANAFYGNALGLGGADAQGEALGTLTSNPLFQGQLGQDSNALARLLNARGSSGGGQAQLAGQRVFQQTAGNWLDRYRDMGSQGFQATNQQSGVRQAQGDNAYGYGATRAGQAINRGNALAEAKGIGINNLFNLAGLGAKAYAGR